MDIRVSPIRLLVVCCLLSFGGRLTADELRVPAREQMLQGLRASHPRLLATGEDFRSLAQLREKHPAVQDWFERLRGEAARLLTKPPVRYEIPDGKRLLAVSREAKDRALLLGLMYRLTQERRYAERLWAELDTVTRFKDWNPSHFLDTAEMTFAVAIGYDWGYDVWSESQREQLVEAMSRLGLQVGLSVYHKQSGWSRAKHNWNQVCNGGLGVGALALADIRPELAAEVLHEAVKSLPLAMHEFAPDGGWGEGPGYWRYATEYNVYFLAALQTAVGRDFGLAQLPGFSVTGDFPLHFTGPTGLTFNYADAHDSWHGAPQLFWLATEFRQPAYAAAQLPLADRYLSALDFVWGARYAANPPGVRELPLDRHFQNVSVVTLRSDWRNERSIFVGFKGGDNRVNHGQLDLGSFVLDALGVRWAIDLGPDDYNIPGYFGKQRWSYYRNSTLGHNGLTFGERNQSTTAQAPILRFASSKSRGSAVADLSAAYPEASRVLRGIALLDRRRILVQDEIDVEQPQSVEWHLHTPADVQISGARALLTEGTQRLSAVILAPEEAHFTVQEATTVPPQRPLRDVRRLSIQLPVDASAGLRLVVLLEPGEHGSGVTPPIVPLEAWPPHE